MKDILFLEPFCGGSHGQLLELLTEDKDIGARCEVFILPAKKWHWRARTSALYFSQIICDVSKYRFLFTSSVLNLAELVALRPELATLKKIVYFHENQLVYPVRKHLERDFQFGYNQILTSMVADVVVFNSKFNMESFLSSISSHLKLIPDHRPKNIDSLIRHKCQVIYFPILLQSSPECDNVSSFLPEDASETTERGLKETSFVSNTDASQEHTSLSDKSSETIMSDQGDTSFNGNADSSQEQTFSTDKSSSSTRSCEQNIKEAVVPQSPSHSLDTISQTERIPLHIVWPHRWEHDKDPESFFNALFQLVEEGLTFKVSVLGESFSEVSDIFHEAKQKLGDRVEAWGFQTKRDYLAILDKAHVVVSTAQHEFFGVSMLEAVSRGCYPLCPKRLVYPEIYPEECLYSTQNQLVKRLRRFCQYPSVVSCAKLKDLVNKFSWEILQDSYKDLFQ